MHQQTSNKVTTCLRRKSRFLLISLDSKQFQIRSSSSIQGTSFDRKMHAFKLQTFQYYLSVKHCKIISVSVITSVSIILDALFNLFLRLYPFVMVLSSADFFLQIMQMASLSQGRLLECAIGEGKAGRVADLGGAKVCDGGRAEGGVGGEGVEEEAQIAELLQYFRNRVMMITFPITPPIQAQDNVDGERMG
ncbi:unnamed protein product [Camellia sinensis]